MAKKTELEIEQFTLEYNSTNDLYERFEIAKIFYEDFIEDMYEKNSILGRDLENDLLLALFNLIKKDKPVCNVGYVLVTFSRQRKNSEREIYSKYNDYSFEESWQSGYNTIKLNTSILKEFINKLPEKDRLVLYNYYFLKMSDKDVGLELGLSKKASERARKKACSKLKDMMEFKGYSYSCFEDDWEDLSVDYRETKELEKI